MINYIQLDTKKLLIKETTYKLGFIKFKIKCSIKYLTKNIKRHPLHRKHSQNSLIHHILKYKVNVYTQGLPGSSIVKESACQCWKHKTHGFDPLVVIIPWRRKWQPTHVFLPGKSYEQRTLSGYSPWGHKSQIQLNN